MLKKLALLGLLCLSLVPNIQCMDEQKPLISNDVLKEKGLNLAKIALYIAVVLASAKLIVVATEHPLVTLSQNARILSSTGVIFSMISFCLGIRGFNQEAKKLLEIESSKYEYDLNVTTQQSQSC